MHWCHATGPRKAPNSERSGERLHQRSCHPKQFQRTIKLPQQGRQLSKQVAPLSINISRTFGLRISSNAWPPMQFYCKHLLRHWFFLSSERHESKEAKNLCSLLGERCSYFAVTIVPKASSLVDWSLAIVTGGKESPLAPPCPSVTVWLSFRFLIFLASLQFSSMLPLLFLSPSSPLPLVRQAMKLCFFTSSTGLCRCSISTSHVNTSASTTLTQSHNIFTQRSRNSFYSKPCCNAVFRPESSYAVLSDLSLDMQRSIPTTHPRDQLGSTGLAAKKKNHLS